MSLYKECRIILKRLGVRRMEKFASKPRISDLFSPPQCKKIYRLLDITESDSSNVRILDEVLLSSGSLVLYSHLEPTPTTNHIKGIIVHHAPYADPVIVCQSYPHTPELSVEDASLPQYRELVTIDESTEVTNAVEGTILRVFCVNNGAWYISTHKKIDGTLSKWSGPTFGELFYDIWGEIGLRKHLIPGYCYVFLLRHPKNRVVCELEKELLLVAVYEPNYNGKLRKMSRREMLFAIPDDTGLNADRPQLTHPYMVQHTLPISTTEKLLEVAGLLDPCRSTGLLVCKDEGKKLFKIVAPGYEKLRAARGNEANIYMGYLSALRDGSVETMKTLREIYPADRGAFDEIEEMYRLLPDSLLDLYNTRYIQSRYLRLLPVEHFVVSRAHEKVLAEKIQPRQSIISILATMSLSQLYSMVV